jgi:hypothetical protein
MHQSFSSFHRLVVTAWPSHRSSINADVSPWLTVSTATSISPDHSNSHKLRVMVSTRSSTRIRQSASPERPSVTTASGSHTTKKEDLPPAKAREERGIRTNVQKPLERVRFSTFIYILICVLLIFVGWYIYRTAIVTLDTFKVTNASGSANPIWEFIIGECKDGSPRYGPQSWCPRSGVERRIEELAEAFGVPPLEFARAIASAVRKVVPPSSLSSLASEAKKTGGGRIMDVLSGERYKV